MKLLRFGSPGDERPGVELPDGRRIAVPAAFGDYDEAFFADGRVGNLAMWLGAEADDASTIAADIRLGPPIARPSKIVCVGLNFRDHAEESGMALPSEPVLFFKATSSLAGPNDPLIIPKGGTKVDWEVELAVVIGRRAAYVDAADAWRHVAGFALHNDYS